MLLSKPPKSSVIEHQENIYVWFRRLSLEAYNSSKILTEEVSFTRIYCGFRTCISIILAARNTRDAHVHAYQRHWQLPKPVTLWSRNRRSTTRITDLARISLSRSSNCLNDGPFLDQDLASIVILPARFYYQDQLLYSPDRTIANEMRGCSDLVKHWYQYHENGR